MWPFKKRASASAVVAELLDAADQDKALLAEFGLKVDDLQVLLLQHAILLLAVKFLPVDLRGRQRLVTRSHCVVRNTIRKTSRDLA